MGAYLQDEFTLDRFRFVLGGRADYSSVAGAIFSPRLALVFQPFHSHAFRVSYNRAFRLPTLLESFQNVPVILTVLDLGRFDPGRSGQKFPIITRSLGNPELREETTSAYEIGYIGEFGNRTTAGAAFYINDNDHNVRSSAIELYTAANPPDGWPLSPNVFSDLARQSIFFPSMLEFKNLGPIRYKGLELSVKHRYSNSISLFANYTYQTDPEVLKDPQPFPEQQLILAPQHLFNAGIDFYRGRFFGSANLQHVSSAFWTDVLDSRFWGLTDSFTMVNTNFGIHWNNGQMTTSLKITNLFNEEIQYHVFGDIVKRSITGEVGFHF